MTVTYEWDVETVDEYGGVQEHDHSNKYPSRKLNHDELIVLVRDLHSDDEGLQDRQWAYVEDNLLPDEFDGGAKVPKRFHVELAKALREQVK